MAKFSLRIALLVVCAVFAACSSEADPARAAPAPEAAAVVVAPVARREYADSIEAIGNALADESVQVTSRVSGRVRAIHFSEGIAVSANAPLVTLEDDEEQAELASARASAEQAQSRYRRTEELSGKGLMSRDALDEQTDVLKNAISRLDLAQVRLDQRVVRAPFAGLLGFRQVSLGALVTPGLAIVSLDKIDTIKVDFAVPETLLTQIVQGNHLAAESAAYPGRRFEGIISTIASRVDPATRSISAQARIRNTDVLLKPGMLLTLLVSGPARTSNFVPESALIPENDKQFIWRIAAGDKAEKVQVSIGTREPGWVEIVSGLQAGDRVVVEGGIHLRPGSPVRVVEAPKKS